MSDYLNAAIDRGDVDLQSLLMFLVFEKEVLKFDDTKEDMAVFFSDQNRPRMIQELNNYKAKLNIKYSMSLFKLELSDHKTVYALAHDFMQAKRLVHPGEVVGARICDADELLHENGRDIKVKRLIKDEKTAKVMGGFA